MPKSELLAAMTDDDALSITEAGKRYLALTETLCGKEGLPLHVVIFAMATAVGTGIARGTTNPQNSFEDVAGWIEDVIQEELESTYQLKH